MKMRRMLLVFCVVVLLPVAGMAAMHVSPFGFMVDLFESEWLVVNSKTLMEDEEIRRYWEKMLSLMESRYSFVDKKELTRMLKSGEVEYWEDKAGDGNVNVTKALGSGVLGRQYGRGEIERVLKKLWGPECRLYDFGWRKIGRFESFWYEYGGDVFGMRSLCLNVQVQKRVYLMFTLTGAQEGWLTLRSRFWDVMRSFQWWG